LRLADGSGKPSVEVGIIGREGITGFAIHGVSARAGKGQRIRAAKLREADERNKCFSGPCCAKLMHTFCRPLQRPLQRTSKIEERFARWLLMARDCSDGIAPHARISFLDVGRAPRRPLSESIRTFDPSRPARELARVQSATKKTLCIPARVTRPDATANLFSPYLRMARRQATARSSI
jgi:hypothetical protein